MVSYRWLARPHRALEIVFFECYNPTSFIFGDKDNDNNQYSQICERFSSEYNDFSNLFYVKNRSHPKVTFKWSSVDQVLLPAFSGVVKTNVLTLQRYAFNFDSARKLPYILSFLSKLGSLSKSFHIFARRRRPYKNSYRLLIQSGIKYLSH